MVSKGKAAKIDQHGATGEPGTDGETAKAPVKSAAAPEEEAPKEKAGGPPLTTLILTDIAMSAGSALLARSVAGRGMAGRVLGKALPLRRPGGLLPAPSLAGSLVGTAIARMATRSVPGAILVGGGLVAKALYERRKTRRAAKAATVTPRKPR